MFLSFSINKRGFWAICAAFLTGVLLGLVRMNFSQPAAVDAAVQEGIPVPVIMYHSILKDESRQGK